MVLVTKLPEKSIWVVTIDACYGRAVAEALFQQGRHDHGLADEAAEQREGGDRHGADDAERCGLGHGLVKPAQI